MSPLNSNNPKIFHFTTSQNNVTITVQKCSVFFSSFFNLCTVYLKKKCSFFLSFFFFFFFHMLCSTMFKFLFLFFLSVFLFHPHCPVAFCFCFGFHFLFFFFFFHNKLLIQCPFFFNLISTSMSLPQQVNYRFASQFIQFQSTVP